ncbi:hypothetical protein N7520_004954 [Penicillium odoratum]|uniref:uncharacterized protein n=1 Tax=Penicillium odoratum TaxID=1167516 RepID=UPI0025488EDC|nr:uncharacterized protein N7520_004954 [Penicillium odoratum]KAJ5765395.1 hypothetical protein N7520_004954 [Penicillium odoratum]
MDRTPVWTAFVTHYLHKRGWLKLVDNRTVVVRDLKLIILMLAKDYNPPMTSRGEHTLKFSTRNDAKDFLEVMEELAIKIVPNSLPPKTASAAEDAGQGLVVTDG